jgi:hypothetical protein
MRQLSADDLYSVYLDRYGRALRAASCGDPEAVLRLELGLERLPLIAQEAVALAERDAVFGLAQRARGNFIDALAIG